MAPTTSWAALQRESIAHTPAIAKLQRKSRFTGEWMGEGKSGLELAPRAASTGTKWSKANNTKTLSQMRERAAALRPGRRRRHRSTHAASTVPSQTAEKSALV